jgi:hypothetical protein
MSKKQKTAEEHMPTDEEQRQPVSTSVPGSVGDAAAIEHEEGYSSWRLQSSATTERLSVWVHNPTGRVTRTAADDKVPPNIAVPGPFYAKMKTQIHGLAADLHVGIDDNGNLELRIFFPSKRYTLTHFEEHMPLKLDTSLDLGITTMSVEAHTDMFDTPEEEKYECEAIRTQIQIKNDTLSIMFIGTPTWGSIIPEVALHSEILIHVGQDVAAKMKSEILYKWQQQAWN